MPTFTNPTDIARETLKLLSTRRVAPTPENYQKIYSEVSGVPAGTEAQSADKTLQKVLQGLARKNPALRQTVEVIGKAIAEHDWKRFESGLTNLVGEPGDEDGSWANLIRELLKQWELKQSGFSVARKRDGLEKVLINFASDSRVLHKKLQALVYAWAKNPVGQAGGMLDDETPAAVKPQPVQGQPVAEAKVLAASADALSKDNFRLLREMLAQTLETGIVPRLTQFPELAGEANQLAVTVRTAESPAELEKLTRLLKQFWVKLELRGESDALVMDGLLKLLKLLVENISELSLDDQWLHGQIAVVQEIISHP